MEQGQAYSADEIMTVPCDQGYVGWAMTAVPCFWLQMNFWAMCFTTVSEEFALNVTAQQAGNEQCTNATLVISFGTH